MSGEQKYWISLKAADWDKSIQNPSARNKHLLLLSIVSGLTIDFEIIRLAYKRRVITDQCR